MRSTDDDPPSLSNSLREGEGARGREGGERMGRKGRTAWGEERREGEDEGEGGR